MVKNLAKISTGRTLGKNDGSRRSEAAALLVPLSLSISSLPSISLSPPSIWGTPLVRFLFSSLDRVRTPSFDLLSLVPSHDLSPRSVSASLLPSVRSYPARRRRERKSPHLFFPSIPSAISCGRSHAWDQTPNAGCLVGRATGGLHRPVTRRWRPSVWWSARLCLALFSLPHQELNSSAS